MMVVDVIGTVILLVLILGVLMVVGVPLAALANFALGLVGHPLGGPTKGSATGIVRPPIPFSLRTRVLERDDWSCVYCGARGKLAADRGGLQIDHIIPVSRGGATVLENLETLCEVCNAEKGAK